MYIKTNLKTREGAEKGNQRIHDHLHSTRGVELYKNWHLGMF